MADELTEYLLRRYGFEKVAGTTDPELWTQGDGLVVDAWQAESMIRYAQTGKLSNSNNQYHNVV